MLIINQWGTSGAEYITDDLKVNQENIDGVDMSCLYVNGLCFAMSEDSNVIDQLQHNLYKFIDRAQRTTDTCDIAVEIKNIINNESCLANTLCEKV